MIDPFVSLLMPQEEQAIQNNISNYIRIEEAIDCRNANSRFFSLLNKESFLNIIISEQSTIISCKLDNQEIVVDRSLYNETHETWALGDRPYQKLSNLVWNSHVRGSELILSSSFHNSTTMNPNAANINSNNNNNNYNSNNNNQHPHTSLYFELTRSNELNCMGRLKTIHLQPQVIYFNLNQATKEKVPIDGHTLAVKCNGNMNRIQVQQTKLLCPCNKLLASKNAFAQSLIGDIPCELMQSSMAINNDGHPAANNPDDIIICDSIYSLESTCALDFLQAHLQFLNRSVVFEVRSVRSVGVSSGNNNVSSSTTPATTSRNKATTTSRQSTNSSSNNNNNIDLRQQVNPAERQEFQGYPQSSTSSSSSSSSPWVSSVTAAQQQHSTADDSIASSSSSSSAVIMNLIKSEQQDSSVLSSSSSSSNVAATSSSTSAPISSPSASNEAKQQVVSNDASVKNPSTLYPSTMLRIRIRVTNFGVCILPHMMTNYTSTYKFNW